MHRTTAMSLIGAERNRQEELKATGKFKYTCADYDLTDADRLVILSEEVGEVARAICDKRPRAGNLRDEVTQVAAVCLAWLESIPA